MTKCSYYADEIGFCPLEAKDEIDKCYWHEISEYKSPNQDQIDDLKKHKIIGAFLSKAIFFDADFKGAYLSKANLQGAKFSMSSLNEANLSNANLQEVEFSNCNLFSVNLTDADLQGAKIFHSNLQRIKLINSNLKNANFNNSNLQGVNLSNTDLQGVNLNMVNLIGSDLSYADLRGAKLINAKLLRSFLCHAIFNSDSRIDGAILKKANIYNCYVDRTKSFKDAVFFSKNSLSEREINEEIADCINVNNVNILFEWIFKKTIILDIDKIKNVDEELVNELKDAGLIHKIKRQGINKKACVGPYEDEPKFINQEVVFYNDIRNLRLCDDDTIFLDHWFFDTIAPDFSPSSKIYTDRIDDIIYNKKKSINEEFLYKGNKTEHYEKSYVVYNKLYNFYLNNGEIEKAKKAHYRKSEVYRKLLYSKGFKSKIRAFFFDWLILKQFTGNGDQIWRPIIISNLFVLIIFPILFWLADGITITGRSDIYWFDYLYMSITTFTGLGFSNIQPNILSNSTILLPFIESNIVIPWAQIIVMSESIFGVMMVALIIFIITFQISR